jgi:hypothetical protein
MHNASETIKLSTLYTRPIYSEKALIMYTLKRPKWTANCTEYENQRE